MTHRNSFGQAFYGGRNPSPFTSNVANTFDRSFSDLYDYVDEDHNVVGAGATSAEAAMEDEDSPDVIHIMYLAQSFPLKFPAFSISEEAVRVHHVRDQVAQALAQHPSRIRLVYKQRDLKRNDAPLKKYGCKQNSVLSVVITSEPIEYTGQDTQSGSDGDSGSGASSNKRRPRPRSNSTYRHRSDDKVPTRTTQTSNGFLHPDHSHHNHHRERLPSMSHTRKTSPARHTRQPSPARPTRQASPPRHTRQPSPSRPTKQPSPPRATATPSPQAPTADPSTPMGKVQALRYEWQSKWLPEVERFLSDPPSDTSDRDKEYFRLSECVYVRILEVGDSILVGDDMDARAIRKGTYTDAQDYLQKLDRFKPAGAKPKQ